MTKLNSRQGRQILFLDIENLVATGSPNCRQVKALEAAIRTQTDYSCGDQAVLAISHYGAHSLFGWTGSCRRLLRSGHNGADLALLEELEDLLKHGQPQKVTLCSGDGIFTDVIGRLQAAGFMVHVIAPRGRTSKRLMMAANSFEFLDFSQHDFDQCA